MQEILPRKTMIIHLKLGIHKFLLTILCLILVAGCARFSQYELEDVEKQRLKFKNGDEKALWLLSDIYKDNSQSYEVRLAALRALSESRHPLIIFDIQSSVRNSSLVELDLMKEAIQMLVSYKEITSIDSLIEALYTTEQKTLEIRTSILNAVGSYGTKDEIQLTPLEFNPFEKAE